MLKRGNETLSEIFGFDAREARSRNSDLFSSSQFRETKMHETYRLDQSDGLLLPSVIFPASGDIEDFFATVATYYQDRSPISALAHILNKETANLFSSRHGALISNIKDKNRPFLIASLGAAIGEATLAGLSAYDLSGAFSYSACKRTLAFSLCRATLLYGVEFRTDVFADRWARLRKLTGLKVSVEATETILFAYELTFESGRTSNMPHVDAGLWELLRGFARGDNGDYLGSILGNFYPATRRFLDDLQGAYDGRMLAFTRVVEAIQAGSRGRRIDEIAVAFACNCILSGSYAHAGVLLRLIDFFPAALIWYGIFSALSKPTASQQLSLGLIAKLERDLIEPFTFEQRPRCDISLEELEILSRTQLRAEVIRPTHQRSLLVSLLPGVDIYTRFGSSGDDITERPSRDAETEEMHSRLSRLLEEALLTLKEGGKGSAREPIKRKQRKSR